jgi:opacity protein-like surface antigen
MRRGGLILLIIMGLTASGARQPALATAKDQMFNLAVVSLGTLGFTTLCHYAWKNSPAERARGYGENLGPGEWYFAGYSGLSLLPSQDWAFSKGFNTLRGHTASVKYQEAAVLGGLKFGRYFDSLPWLGLEMETNFSGHTVKQQQVTLSPPLASGQSQMILPHDRFYIWNMQVNLLLRHGLLKDKEVTFGRLQPYLGLGPGFEVIYGETDSAKNFAIETLAGLRYMCTPHLAVFVEYKFSYQFRVEIEQKRMFDPAEQGVVTFDVPHHRLILGVSYHFKNLYGN